MNNPESGPQKHHRRSIRLKGYDYASAGAYFVTIVTHGRECLFGEIVNGQIQLNVYGHAAAECWRALPEHFPNVELGAYVFMPNHVHGIIVIHDAGENGAAVNPPPVVGRGMPRPYHRTAHRHVHWAQSWDLSNRR